MSKELLSIIVPIYNTAPYLDRCIESIISQTYTNIEVICINDGSTDESVSIIGKWQKKDARIKAYNKENGGVASARNYGLEKARGAYIGWVDSDDWVERDYYETLMNAITSNMVEIAIGDKNKKDIKLIKNNEIMIEFLMDRLTRTLWKTVISRSLFKDLRFKNFSIGEDTFMLCCVLEKANSICLVPSDGYHYEIRTDSAVHGINLSKYQDWIDMYLLMQKHVVKNSESLKFYCSYRLIIEMGVIYDKICNASIEIKRFLLNRMRKIYFKSLLKIKVKNLSFHDFKRIIYIGIHIFMG